MKAHHPLSFLPLGLTLLVLNARSTTAQILPSIQSRTDTVEYVRPEDVPSDEALEHAGARNGTVRIVAQPLFDTSNPKENTSLFRLANRIRFPTRESTIADQLLFKAGDPFRGRLLEETERLLRSARYLRDAHVQPVVYDDGVVDIEVITQDVWTLNPGASFGRKGGANTSGFGIEEQNLLGLGMQLGIGYNSGVDRNSTTIFYRDPQLGGSWWDLSVRYSDNSDGRLGELSIDHPFYALDSRWAAGLSLVDDRRVDSRYDLGEVIDRFENNIRQASFHWGRSGGLRNGWTRRLKFGATYDDRHFASAPGEEAALLLPEDRKLVYPFVGLEWVQDEFLIERNREQIEKTEDIELGWSARAQVGFAGTGLGSDRNALMLSGDVSKGLQADDRQTLLLDAHIDGRLESGGFAGTVVGGSARYYFRQSSHRLLFASLSTDAGIRLDADTQILLGGDNGLRGYPLRYQAGEGRWVFTMEQRYFTNWYPFRLFNVGGAIFYDMGGTWGRDPLGSASLGTLKDVGFGLRLGNSRSARGNVLHIDVAFPLDGDDTIKNVQFLVETKASF